MGAAIGDRIGFVGLGIMGSPMARNLSEAGFELTVFNRTSSKAEEFSKGSQAEVAYNLEELARQSDVVVTMLTGQCSKLWQFITVRAVTVSRRPVFGNLSSRFFSTHCTIPVYSATTAARFSAGWSMTGPTPRF